MARPVPAAADDDHVVTRLRLGVAPLRAPAAIAGKALPEDLEGGKAHAAVRIGKGRRKDKAVCPFPPS